MTVTALARKPIVRAIPGPDILGELKDTDSSRASLISIYLPDAGVQVMYFGEQRKLIWYGAWATLSFEEAVECAREQAYERQLEPDQNFLYIPKGFDRGESGYLWGDFDAGSECLDIRAVDKYQYRGDDCLLCLYDPASQELQQYRLNDGVCVWWWKGGPYTLKQAKLSANNSREERALTFEQVRFINVKPRYF